MITTPEQYKAHLHIIQSLSPPKFFPLNSVDNEKIYFIDLNTRTVESPDFLGALEDLASETIYFKVDRFYDYMDLATTSCIIEYVNAQGEGGIYAVPFYDVVSFSNERQMLIPWCINSLVTKAAGNVQFQIFFYKIEPYYILDENGNKTGSTEYRFNYKLNIQPATSEVLHALSLNSLLDIKKPEVWPTTGNEAPGEEIPTIAKPEDVWLNLNQRIQQIRQQQAAVHWIVIE